MAAVNRVIVKFLILFMIFGSIWTKSSSSKKCTKTTPKLIVISMDGLMPREVQPNLMPYVTNFYKNGIFCPRLQSVFPTKTFVNHFSIATGFYGASHGVTMDEFYDRKYKKMISYSSEMFTLRPNITPIWTLYELAGKHSAVLMWTAGEFEFRGKKPTYYESYNREANEHWKPRIDRIIPLLTRNESQVDLVMFYNNSPDAEDHEHSPSSPQVYASLKDMDDMVRYFSEQIDNAGLSSVTDMILVSDHGMDTYYFNRDDVDGEIIDLYRVVGNDTCDFYGSSPVLQVIAKDGFNQDEICLKLKSAAAQNGNYNVYFDYELKERWHIQNEQRFGPCTVVGNPPYVFQDQTATLKQYTDYDKLIPGVSKFGEHGYDNLAPIMQAVFMARGPRFKKGVEISLIHNIDLYFLFARLLHIESLAEDLDLDGVDRRKIWRKMLKKPRSKCFKGVRDSPRKKHAHNSISISVKLS